MVLTGSIILLSLSLAPLFSLSLRDTFIIAVIDNNFTQYLTLMEPKSPLDHYDWAHRTKLGEGSFSVVYKVKRKDSEEYVAIKRVNMMELSDPIHLTALTLQIQLMKNLKSEYTVQLYEAQVGRQHTYLIMELCDGDLRKKLNACKGKLGEQGAIKIFSQILKGFRVLIDKGYIHRDAKPENILTKGTHFKLTDFGMSCKADMNYIEKLDEICGTPLYMAPQILHEQLYTAKCDIWSLGIILYEMIFGYGPWVCRNMEAYRFNIFNKPLSFPYNAKIGQNTKDLIRKCLVIDQKKRIGWKQLFEHPLVNQKNAGDQTKVVDITQAAVQILRRIQQSASRKSVNVLAAFQKKNIENMSIKQLEEVCSYLDPSVSSFEVRMLFECIDVNDDEAISYKEFKQMVLENDFRDANDIANRFINEIVQIIKFRKLDSEAVFKLYDKNISGTIDANEFTKLVKEFLPRMPEPQISVIFRKFDKDGSGDISLKEFQYELTHGVINPANKTQLNLQKAIRCITALKAAIKYYEVDQATLLSVFDINKDNKMDYKQFCNMVFAIDKYLPQEQLKLMFNYIDKDRGGSIDPQQLKKCLF